VLLFLLGWSVAGGLDTAAGADAVVGVAERLPPLDSNQLATWAAPSGSVYAASIAHSSAEIPNARHVYVEPHRIALFSGRPYRWTDDDQAEGRATLDARLYLGPPDGWAPSLDGRFVVLTYDDELRELTVCTDPLGGYPVYTTKAAGGLWISNNAHVLASLRREWTLDPRVLASQLGCGWSLSGDPWWAGVERLPRGAVTTYRDDRPPTQSTLLPLAEIVSMLGSGFDPKIAARTLVSGLTALADWPGRPSIIPITGGRDSRLVLAAGLAAGLEFQVVTRGSMDSPDVVVGRQICELLGIPHARLPEWPQGAAFPDPRRLAEVVAIASSGTVCPSDVYTLRERSDGSSVLWHSGAAGDIARSHYGLGESRGSRRLCRQLAHAELGPGWSGILSREGRNVVEAALHRWVGEQLDAGVRPVDVPDVFYLLNRMTKWAAPAHGFQELTRDTTSALWARRLLPCQLGLPPRERQLELFHRRVLGQMAADLVDLPFAHGDTWHRRRRAHRSLTARLLLMGTTLVPGSLMARHARALGRRPRGVTQPKEDDPFASVLADTRELVHASPHHSAWQVLDQRRVRELLSSEPHLLPRNSRQLVWRLLGVFAGPSRDM
jgi:hypothetical protein